MHHTKRAARSLAWRDPGNPFSKSTMTRKRNSSSLSQAEQGQANGDGQIFRTNTHNSLDYRTQENASSSSHVAHHTAPESVSRQRHDEPGDHIGPIPESQSPRASLKDVKLDTSESPETEFSNTLPRYSAAEASGAESPKKGTFIKWITSFSSSSSDDLKDEKDANSDDNGKNKPKFTPWSQIKGTIFNSKINILLIACPVGIALHFAKVKPAAVFVVNFIAIIPLAGLLSFATEEIALRTGEVLGGLLNASFGNAVELIVSIIALVQNEILIVQTSLIGSILSNLLLVLGMCFFAGGANRIEQEFNVTVAQTAASLLFLAVSSLLIPTAFDLWANRGVDSDAARQQQQQQESGATTAAGTPILAYGVQQLSLATAVLLLFVYLLFLFFQLKSHKDMYQKPSNKNEKRDFTKQKERAKRLVPSKMRRRSHAPISPVTEDGAVARRESDSSNEPEVEEPTLSLWVAIATLAAATVLVALNAEFLVDSINAITCTGAISKTFVGLILLPIVGNAAEHATSVTVAIKDKMDLAIGVAVGSSMQIALLVLPFMVVLGQIIGKDDMTLYFDGFQLAILFVTVLLVNYLIQDGKSHWLEGALLMILYIIIAVAAWYYPTKGEQGNTC